MTDLGVPLLLGAPTASGARRSVTLLSGFLGSGKTTLLRAALQSAGDGAPAVVVNDFAATQVDDALLAMGGHDPVVLTGGCACCTRLDDLAGVLAGLLDDEQYRREGRRDVVVETSGLSDPGPIAFTIANDPVLRHHYALARVCVTVDALTGINSLHGHPVAFRQALAADELIVTKADLVSPEAVEDVVGELKRINPSASVRITAAGELVRTDVPLVGAAGWSRTSPLPESTHTDRIATLELATDDPIDWEVFAVWLSLLVHRRGPDVLRVKALLDVRDVGTVAVHGVQHVIHRPEHVPGLGLRGCRIVLIVRDIDPTLLERSFHTFLNSQW